MQLISAMPRFNQTTPVRMGSQKNANNDPNNEIDYSKVDWKLQADIQKGKLPIALFVKSTQTLDQAQLQELKDLGMNVNPIAGNINTARLVRLDQFAQITKKPYIQSMQGATQMRPNFE